MTRGKLSFFYSLRFRLIAGVVAIEVVMLSLLVWSNITIIHTTHADRLQDTANSLIQQIADTSGSYMLAVDYASLQDYLNKVVNHKELSYVVVLDRDEKPVVSLGAVPGVQWPAVDEHPSEVDDAIYNIVRAIQVSGEPMGQVLAGFSLSWMESAINKARFRGIVIAVSEIFLTVLATVLIGLHLTRRLGALANAAELVGAGDYSVSVPTETADEVGTTAAAFNRMVAEVSSRTRLLEQEEEKSRQLLAENRRLVHASLEVQEEERKHLARELHDELGQCITAIQADAESIRDLSAGRDTRTEASAGAILDVSSRIYDVVHSMMTRLRPGILDDLGLVAALRDDIAAWMRRNPQTTCSINATGQLDNLGERTNITVYRIVQECLTNVAKHAGASNVTIDLTGEIDRLLLRIEDDGRGMSVDDQGGGLGLIGMRERVEALGGVFRTGIDGTGFLIDISIPLPGQAGTHG
ncbi:MAG: ATP-binding protein [Gammaproteobacteria bacterium]